jgi:hypothetical protein
MSLFLSAATDTESETARFSLASEAHIKIYRIWMFAMSKDHPTSVERRHISSCRGCGDAFRLASGVSGFSDQLNELRRASKDSSHRDESADDDRAA